MTKSDYALYKGDTLLIIGTVEEISKELKIKEQTVTFYRSPAYKKRTTENKGRRLVKLDNDEMEEQ